MASGMEVPADFLADPELQLSSALFSSFLQQGSGNRCENVLRASSCPERKRPEPSRGPDSSATSGCQSVRAGGAGDLVLRQEGGVGASRVSASVMARYVEVRPGVPEKNGASARNRPAKSHRKVTVLRNCVQVGGADPPAPVSKQAAAVQQGNDGEHLCGSDQQGWEQSVRYHAARNRSPRWCLSVCPLQGNQLGSHGWKDNGYQPVGGMLTPDTG